MMSSLQMKMLSILSSTTSIMRYPCSFTSWGSQVDTDRLWMTREMMNDEAAKCSVITTIRTVSLYLFAVIHSTDSTTATDIVHRSRRNATTTRWAIIINPRILIRRRCGLVALARVVVCFRNCHFYYCVENRFRWYKFSIDVASSQDEESHCNRRRRRIRPINYLFHTSDDDYEIEQ